MATLQLDRKKRDILLRKSDILKAAERVFARKGFHRATMSDIAEEAQYAVGTLYLYFKDKQNLYLNLFEEKMKELIRQIKQRTEEAGGAYEKIKILIKTEMEFFIGNKNFFRIFFSVREGLRLSVKDMVSSPVTKLMFQLLDYITEVIKQAQSQGLIEKDCPPRKIAYILQHLVRSVFIPYLIEEAEFEEDVVGQSDFVLKVFLKGLGIK